MTVSRFSIPARGKSLSMSALPPLTEGARFLQSAVTVAVYAAFRPGDSNAPKPDYRVVSAPPGSRHSVRGIPEHARRGLGRFASALVTRRDPRKSHLPVLRSTEALYWRSVVVNAAYTPRPLLQSGSRGVVLSRGAIQ